MNLRDLHYLTSVADHLHFGKAAQACHVSQPTLSMQLKKLEEQLGVALFERSHKHVMITPIGQEIVSRARQILQQSKEIQAIAKLAQDPLAGDFRLGSFPTLAPYFLPLAVPYLHHGLPKLRLLLIEEKTETLLHALHTGTLDAALIALPVDQSGLETMPLFQDPFLLAVAPSHALAKRKQVSLDDIQDEALLLLEEGHCLRTQALEVCQRPEVPRQQEFRATSLETLRSMVATGVGITLIPKIATKTHDGIVYIPFKDKPFARTIGLVARKSHPRREAVQTIYTLLRPLCQRLSPSPSLKS